LAGDPPPPSPAPCCKIVEKKPFTVFLGVFTHTPPEGGENWDLEKQTLSTDQKSTFQTNPKKANPINKPEINSSNLGKGYLA